GREEDVGAWRLTPVAGGCRDVLGVASRVSKTLELKVIAHVPHRIWRSEKRADIAPFDSAEIVGLFGRRDDVPERSGSDPLELAGGVQHARAIAELRAATSAVVNRCRADVDGPEHLPRGQVDANDLAAALTIGGR